MDARDVIAVGATYWSNDALEPFSSQGPTNDDRTKPDVVAPDGVSTSVPLLSPFNGTSASAPHAAGAAALLLGINPSPTNQTLRTALESTEKDLGTVGKDNLTGSGRIDVWAAYKIPPTVFAYFPVDQCVNNGTILHLNASITSISGVKNATVNMTVKVDNVPPNVTISSPVNNSIVDTQNVTIIGNVTDNFGIVCGLLEHSWQNLTPPGPTGGCGSGGGGGGYLKNLSLSIPITLHEGWNRLVLTYIDVAGNSGNASVNVTLDTIPPAVANLSLSTSTPEINDPVNITVNVSDIHLNISSIVISVRSPSGYMNTSQMNGSTGSYYYNYTNTSEYGRYDMTINASDNASNVNNTEKTWFVTIKSHRFSS